MFNRRLLLRLAVALITFVVGLSAATLFGAGRRARFFAPRAHAFVYYVPYDPPQRELESPLPPPCGSYKMQHAFERHAWHSRAFDFDAPPPPAPPQPSYDGR